MASDSSKSPKLVSFEAYDDERQEQSLTTTLPGYPGWLVDVTLARQEGTFVVRSIRVQPHGPARRMPTGSTDGPTPDGGITALMLRAVPLSQFARLLAKKSAGPGRTAGDLLELLYGREHVKELVRRPRPGGAGRDDAFYARWAVDYEQALRKGSSPNADLAKKHNYSKAMIREFVAEARRRGLLSPAQRGKAGGEATERARALLRKAGS